MISWLNWMLTPDLPCGHICRVRHICNPHEQMGNSTCVGFHTGRNLRDLFQSLINLHMCSQGVCTECLPLTEKRIRQLLFIQPALYMCWRFLEALGLKLGFKNVLLLLSILKQENGELGPFVPSAFRDRSAESPNQLTAGRAREGSFETRYQQPFEDFRVSREQLADHFDNRDRR